MKRSVWSAPAVERVASTLLASLPATYRAAVDFQLLTRESGSVRHDLPIWVSTPSRPRSARTPNGQTSRATTAHAPPATTLQCIQTALLPTRVSLALDRRHPVVGESRSRRAA